MPNDQTYLVEPNRPIDVPRFAQSYRCYIDHPDWRERRLLTGEWQMAPAFAFFLDVCPQLAKAGRLGFIASTTPVGYHGAAGLKDYYGDADYPALYWHWKPGAIDWEWPSDKRCRRFAEINGYPLGLLRIPRGQDAPPHLRA